MPNLLFIDFETTGLDFLRHSIHRMAGEVVINNKVACQFDYRMKPEPTKLIDMRSLDIAGVSYGDILKYENPMKVYQRYLDEIISPFVSFNNPSSKLFIVAYNAGGLEMPFMREWYRSLHISREEFSSHYHSGFIDVMSHATQYFIDNKINIASYSLSSIATHLGIEVDKSKLHNPVYDVELTRKVYEHIISNK